MTEGLDKQDGAAEEFPAASAGEGLAPVEQTPGAGTTASPTTPGTPPEALAAAAVTDDPDLEAAWAEALAESETAAAVPAKEPAIREPPMDFAHSGAAAARPTVAHPAEFPQFSDSSAGGTAGSIDMLLDVNLPVSIELGRTTLPIGNILQWGPGSIVELDKLAGEPVNLLVNNVLVARGEVVVVDENFGLRITSLLSPRERGEQT